MGMTARRSPCWVRVSQQGNNKRRYRSRLYSETLPELQLATFLTRGRAAQQRCSSSLGRGEAEAGSTAALPVH